MNGTKTLNRKGPTLGEKIQYKTRNGGPRKRQECMREVLSLGVGVPQVLLLLVERML